MSDLILTLTGILIIAAWFAAAFALAILWRVLVEFLHDRQRWLSERDARLGLSAGRHASMVEHITYRQRPRHVGSVRAPDPRRHP